MVDSKTDNKKCSKCGGEIIVVGSSQNDKKEALWKECKDCRNYYSGDEYLVEDFFKDTEKAFSNFHIKI